MATDNEAKTALLRAEVSRLEKQLPLVEYGQIGLTLVLHHGEITRVIRTLDLSVKPSGDAA